MTTFDPAELARLAEAIDPTQDWHGQVGRFGAAGAAFDMYANTHRAALVAALTRAQETEKAIERVEALHVPDEIWQYDDVNGVWVTDSDGEKILMQRVCRECSDDDALEDVGDCNWYEGDSRLIDYPCPSIAALGGATRTTGDIP